MNMEGHNRGPSMAQGTGWRKHCWAKARRELMPKLPIEILRRRVARAKELGLDYTSYASIRAASGHDVIAFLFSSNALRVFPKQPVMTAARVGKISSIKNTTRLAALHAPLTPETLAKALPDGVKPLFEASFTAPDFSQNWGQVRAAVLGQIKTHNLPQDGVVVIGDTSHERAWSEAARLAGYLSADRFFGEGA